jgi:hypothetical protein
MSGLRKAWYIAKKRRREGASKMQPSRYRGTAARADSDFAITVWWRMMMPNRQDVTMKASGRYWTSALKQGAECHVGSGGLMGMQNVTGVPGKY